LGYRVNVACLRLVEGRSGQGFKVVLLKGAHSTYDFEGKTAGEVEREVEERLEGERAEVVGWEGWRP
jgi:hypothetical protein